MATTQQLQYMIQGLAESTKATSENFNKFVELQAKLSVDVKPVQLIKQDVDLKLPTFRGRVYEYKLKQYLTDLKTYQIAHKSVWDDFKKFVLPSTLLELAHDWMQ